VIVEWRQTGMAVGQVCPNAQQYPLAEPVFCSRLPRVAGRGDDVLRVDDFRGCQLDPASES
jgi:hypothetical protein